MITVEEAKSIILKSCKGLTKTQRIKIQDSLGLTLAKDIYAPIDLPPFNQSNVDGYAVCFISDKQNSWKLIGEVKAGDNPTVELKPGEAVRIFTGAAVPVGADAVIMQEKIRRDGNTIYCNDGLVQKGDQVRMIGAQIREGALALSKGVVLNPPVLGFLASLGISEISVYKMPNVIAIITGDELQMPGTELQKGKVYESNSVIIKSALESVGIKNCKLFFAQDKKENLVSCIQQALKEADLLLISGGISVGDYDFVSDALAMCNVEQLFHKIAQKPGKPLYFGKENETLVFGLPGNPASVFTCFYEYVYPAIRSLMNSKSCFLRSIMVPLSEGFAKKAGLANFLKAKFENNVVFPLEGQESFKTKSFADANAFIYLHREQGEVHSGEQVEVHLFPNM